MAKKIKRRTVDLDEVIREEATEELGFKELPLKARVFKSVFYISTLIIAVILARIIFLGGIKHEHYIGLAARNVNQEVKSVAARGPITDRYGKDLVFNEPVFNVILDISLMVKYGEEEDILKDAEEILGLTREKILKLVAAHDLESSPSIVIKRDIEVKQVIDIKSLNLESFYIEDGYKRKYLSESLSHILGFVGLNEDDNVSRGRSGLEAYYDEILKGKDGAKIFYKNAQGEIEDTEVVSEPKQGNKLQTTIDYDLQEYFYNRFMRGLQSLGRTAGVGLAFNPKNGEILALMSLPSFDPNKIADYLSNPDKPLFNRAVSGVYNPGSTIKPVHATAILEEGIVSPQYQVFSAGYIEIPNPYYPDKPSRFVDWKAHGLVDLYSALARSSNVYFYETVGGFGNLSGLGIERLKSYWEKFGFGKKTDIDLPSEASGFLPDPQNKEKRTGSPWRLGDTYNVAIGQGDVTVTPLQLLNAITAIANHGKVYVPHLKIGEEKLLFDISYLETKLKEVRHGMEDAVSETYGTAHLLSNLPLKVAAKTGSAQTTNNTKTNALFVGYAPAADPQIAILVLIEDAKEGSLNAVPIAEDVFRWYSINRIKNE